MFDLEPAIADWRKQMLAAGIKMPAPLEELENHLRDDVESQIWSGANEQRAFEIAVQHIGPTIDLQMEFAKTRSLSSGTRDERITTIYRIPALLWFVQCTWFFFRFALSPVAIRHIQYFPSYWQSFTVFLVLLSLVGIIGSMCLFRGAKSGLSIVRILAMLQFVVLATEIVTADNSFGEPNLWFVILLVFDLVTIWLLRLPPRIEAISGAGVRQ